MLACLSERSAHEEDRREGRLVFRGYAEAANRCERYPIPIHDRLLIEAPTRHEAERVLRSADPSSIMPHPWVLEGFRVVELLPDNPFAPIHEWRYDHAMQRAGRLIHDRRIRFKGREAARCRFAIDELVECRYQDSIVLGRVVALPLSPAEVENGRVRGLCLTMTTDLADVERYADQSDDLYTVDYLDVDDFNDYPECLLRLPPDSGECTHDN